MALVKAPTTAKNLSVRIGAKAAPYLDDLYERRQDKTETMEQFCSRLLRQKVRAEYLAYAQDEAARAIQEKAVADMQALEAELTQVSE